MTDLGPIIKYLEIEIKRTPIEITLYQRSYLTTVLERFEIINYIIVRSPMDLEILKVIMSPIEEADKVIIK